MKKQNEKRELEKKKTKKAGLPSLLRRQLSLSPISSLLFFSFLSSILLASSPSSSFFLLSPSIFLASPFSHSLILCFPPSSLEYLGGVPLTAGLNDYHRFPQFQLLSLFAALFSSSSLLFSFSSLCLLFYSIIKTARLLVCSISLFSDSLRTYIRFDTTSPPPSLTFQHTK